MGTETHLGTHRFSSDTRKAGKNGATIGNALAVEAQGKLTTTWGKLKQ